MTELGASKGLMNIGEEAKPPFVVLPDTASLFLNRSKRLRTLASGHALEAYLNFVAEVIDAQHEIQSILPRPVLPDTSQIEQALAHGMPPLSRTTFEADRQAEDTLTCLLQKLRLNSMPEEGAAAITALIGAPADRRRQSITGALKHLPPDNIAERVLVLAALQVHFARLAAMLDAGDLRPIADGICPVCASAPMTSSVVGWPKAHNTRFCSCSLCGTMWHAVRIKCVLCSSTEGISYQAIEGQPETVKAETCDKCGRYVKILYQVNDPALDPLGDDVASLGLDLMLAEEGWVRGGDNPFLLGY